MTTPSPQIPLLHAPFTATLDGFEPPLTAFQRDLREFLAKHSREIPSLDNQPTLLEAPLPKALGKLATGGVVVITDEGRGIARAVAADLRAMGHPVFRVRHGVSGGGVEGVNLTSAAAVAALIDRAREIGPIAAIVHLLPLRVPPAEASPTSADHRSLQLLVHAASGELRRAAECGGASVITANWETESSRQDAGDVITPVDNDLAGVRVRNVWIDEEAADTEVLAANLVREVLAADANTDVAYHEGLRFCRPAKPASPPFTDQTDSQAILLGAPHRLAWMELAEALIAWIGRYPHASLLDLAFTLAHGQPAYPFRVAIVAESTSDLANQLREMTSRASGPGAFVAKMPKTGRHWLQNIAAERFEAGLPFSNELLFLGTTPRRIDLESANVFPTSEPLRLPAHVKASGQAMLRAMDDLLLLQRALTTSLMQAIEA